MYPQRARFDAKVKAVLDVLAEAGYVHEAPVDLLYQAMRRALGMTRGDAMRSFVETMKACGYVGEGSGAATVRLHRNPESLAGRAQAARGSSDRKQRPGGGQS